MNVVRVLLKALTELHGLELQVASRLDRHRLKPDESDLQVLDRLSAIARDAEAAVKELDKMVPPEPGTPPRATLLERVVAIKTRLLVPISPRDVQTEMAETLLAVRRLDPYLDQLRGADARVARAEVRARLNGKLIVEHLPES